MNWEPMTEEAVFEEGEWLLICDDFGHVYIAQYWNGLFDVGDDTLDLARHDITHFDRLTNPNEVKP